MCGGNSSEVSAEDHDVMHVDRYTREVLDDFDTVQNCRYGCWSEG